MPALVVYYLIKQFSGQQANLEVMKQRAALSSDTTSLRMQSYERLILLVERIGLVDTLMRLDAKETSVQHLSNAMLITVQKEYEHNLTQQIYVSGQLWDMITLLKDETMASISEGASVQGAQDKNTFRTEIYRRNDQIDSTFGRKVREAIRKEVELYFK